MDKREVYRVTRAMVEQHGRWAFDNPKHLILNLALGGNYPRERQRRDATPYRGLPEATVQRSEQRGEDPGRLGAGHGTVTVSQR